MILKSYSEEELSFFPLYLHVTGSHHLQETISCPTGKPFLQILIVQNGCGILKINGDTHILTKGDMFFLTEHTPHAYYSTSSEPFLTGFLAFYGKGVSSILEYYNICKDTFFPQKSTGIFEDHLLAIQEQADAIHETSRLCAMTFSAVIAFFDEATRKTISPIEQVRRYIEQNYANALTLEDILSVYPFSKSKLCREFKNTYQMTIFQMITHVRLKNAKLMLQSNPDIKLSTLAHACGFSDTSYFCKMYKSVYGVSPKADISV